MKDYLRVGLIINTHGVRGELKILPLTSDISRFNDLDSVLLEKEDDYIPYVVDRVRYHKGFVLLKLSGIENLNESSELKNLYLAVDREHARKLGEDEYFICDLIGCEVYEEDIFLGKLSSVIQTGSNDVYVVKSKKREICIPALKSVVNKVDIKNKKITVKLPKGLIDDEV